MLQNKKKLKKTLSKLKKIKSMSSQTKLKYLRVN